MEIKDNRKKVKQRAQNFLSALKTTDKVLIVGRNKYGLALAQYLHTVGVLDLAYLDDRTELTEFLGYPIHRSHQVGQNAKIINCVVEGRVIDSETFINTLAPSDRSDYFSLELLLGTKLVALDFMDDTESIFANVDSYGLVYNLLQDTQSKNEFEALVNFRLNRDIEEMKNFEVRLDQQYFEPFINWKSVKTFVDGGCFDGKTAVEFSQKQPSYEHIFVFEPNSDSFNTAQKNLSELPNITFFRKGLWEAETTLRFSPDQGSASNISDNGSVEIETTSIDIAIDTKVDFIKLDIEGAELSALRGASNTIRRCRPKLAVCVYHKQSDFTEIPKYLLQLEPSYKVFLRHYTQGIFETVMYFL